MASRFTYATVLKQASAVTALVKQTIAIADSVYFRPDGTSKFLRPDGVSEYKYF